MSAVLDDAGLLEGCGELVAAFEACGFAAEVGGLHPTWLREVAPGDPESDLDKVVLWRHPRMLDTLHAHVATTRVAHMVHLRFFDPQWQPATLLPGHLDKGWRFASSDALVAIAAMVREVLWPRALAWFEQPVEAEELLRDARRVPGAVAPQPLLERHCARADWLDSVGRSAEAAWLRALVARIEQLYG